MLEKMTSLHARVSLLPNWHLGSQYFSSLYMTWCSEIANCNVVFKILHLFLIKICS
jgi:hypothetical protein